MADVQETIWLNDVEFPLDGKVQRRKSTSWPPEFRSGRIEAQDYTHTRKQMWGPLNSGMGKEDWEPGADDRFWTSTDMETALSSISLGPLVTTMGEATASKDFGIAPIKIIPFQDEIYSIGHNEIAYWDATASNWVTAEPATPLPSPTDAVVYYSVVPSAQTFHPDADPESTSVDGEVEHKNASGDTWANIRDGAGTTASDSGNYVNPAYIEAYSDASTWEEIARGIFLLDVSAVPTGATVTAAAFSLYGYNKYDDASWAPSLNVYAAAPASNTDLVAGDYDSLGTTAYCATAITYAAWSTSGYNDFALNATGIAAVQTAVDGDNIVKLGTRDVAYDVGDSAPAWAANKKAYFVAYQADMGSPYVPKLVVTYTTTSGVYGECLCVASSSGRSAKTSEATGGTWTPLVEASTGALNATYLAQFDNRLCSLASTNKGFAYSDANDIYADWTDKTNFPNLPDDFTDLFVGKNAADEKTLYFLTPRGLHYLDVFTNFISEITDVQWEEDANSGKVGIYWMGDKYIATNKGVLKISGRTVTLIGPDQDDGLETLRQGVITDMIGVGPWLVAAIDNSDATTHFSSILKRYVTGNHWHTVYKSGTANKRIRALMWKNGTLYFGEDTNVKSLPFPATTDNVKLASGHTYATAGNFELPKFDGGFQAIPKVLHKLWAITQDCATAGALNEVFDISYKINDATAYTSLGSFSTSPKPTALVWPDATSDAIGLECENAQLKVAATRGTTTTNSPKLKSLVLEYRVVPPVIYDWTMTVKAVKYGGKRGQDFIDALETAVASKTLLKFYPTGKKGDTCYLVEVKSLPRAVKGTVYGQEGDYQLHVGQVVD